MCATWESKAAHTRISYHSALRHWLVVLGVNATCFAAIPHVVTPEAPTRTVTDEEFERALAWAPPPTALLMLLCRDAGLRSGTAARLTAAEVIDGGVISVKTKNGAAVVIPMSERLAMLVGLAAAKVPKGARLCRWGMADHHKDEALLTIHLVRLHSIQRKEGLTRWGFHDLRRTAARRLYEASGHQLHRVASFLGHKSVKQTLHYLNAERAPITLEDVRALASKPEVIQ